ncbi:MAG: asparagine synthase [Thaumarchaeota archaeon]|nr:MAG: asparagine synthase [Nitrososphaerota archaeon]
MSRFAFIWVHEIVASLSDLKQALYGTVSESVPEDKIAVAFSGGVDSSLLAKICQDLGKKLVLITVGFPGSHDIRFAKGIALKMGIEHSIFEIDHSDFQENLRRVRQAIKCENTSHIENCIAYFYISKLTMQNDLSIVVSANGCDELFCGYDGYRMAYSGGESAIVKLMEQKIANELALVEEIAKVAGQFEVLVKQPFLSRKFVEFAKTIPIDQKINGSHDMTRKHILRQVALSIGVPTESAMKPKKALQYGSLIHKYFKK